MAQVAEARLLCYGVGMGKRTQLGHTGKGKIMTHSKAVLVTCLMLFLSLGVGCRNKTEARRGKMIELLQFSRDMDPGETVTKKDIRIVQVDRRVYEALGYVVPRKNAEYVIGRALNQSVKKDDWVKYDHVMATGESRPAAKPATQPAATTKAAKPATPKVRPQAAVPGLIAALKDKDNDWKVRSYAAEALGAIGPDAKAAVPALIAALNDDQWRVQPYATEALGKIGAAAVLGLIAALKDKDPHVRSNAADALGAIGPDAKAVVPGLIAALKDNDWKVRWYAAKILGAIGPGAKAAGPGLIAALKDNDWKVRSAAAEALGAIGPDAKAAVPGLIAALKDNDRKVRSSAAEALKKIRAAQTQPATTKPTTAP